MIRVVNPRDRRTGLRRNLRRSLLVGTLLGSLAFAAPASADPISTAIALALPVGTSSAVAALVVSSFWTAVQFAAASALSSVLAKKAQSSQRDRQGDVLTLQLGEVPREAAFGRVCSGGSLVNAWNGGGAHGTDHETQVIALADHECDGLEGVYIDDKYVPFVADGPVTGESGLEIHWRPGTEGQTFPASLKTGSGWDGDDNLAGVAHVWVRYTAGWVEQRRGRAAFRFVFRGAKLYDPRLDSTVPGGSGPQRWSNPATRVWSENAYLARYNFARGLYACNRVDDLGELLLGRGLSEMEAPPERAIAWANLCDEAVPLKAGGTQKRYTVGGIVRADQPYIEVEQWFADAMGGWIVQPEGGIDVEPGAAKSVVVEITDDDLVLGEKVVARDFRAEPRKINTVTARYPEPSQAWNETDAPIRRDLDDLAADRRPLVGPMTLPLVTAAGQVQRLMEIRRRASRLERAYEIVLPPRFQRYEEADWIGWTSDRYFGGARVVFRIEARDRREARRVGWRLEEVSAETYDWTAATDEITPGTVAPTPSTPAGALTLSGASASVVTQGGVPFLRFAWTPPTDPAIRTVTVEARVKGQTQTSGATTDEPSRGALDLTNGVAPNTLMQWRIYPRGEPGRAYTPTAWTDIQIGTLNPGVDTTSKTTNAAPSAYRAKGVGQYVEVKWRDALGAPGSGADVEGVLTTVVLSTAPGALVGQRFEAASRVFVRWEATSPADSWGAWTEIFSETHKPDWDTDIQNRAPWLTDDRVPTGLDSDGRLIAGVTPFDRLSGRTADRMTYVGGGGASVESLRPAAPNADPTGSNHAAGVIGAGAALWWNTVPVGGIDPGAVLARNLAATVDTAQVNVDPDFQDLENWLYGAGQGGTSISTNAAAVAALGRPRLAFTGAGNGTPSQAGGFVTGVVRRPVTPGEWLTIAQGAYVTNGYTGRQQGRLHFYNASGAEVTAPAAAFLTFADYRTVAASGAQTEWLSSRVQVPAGAVSASINQYASRSTVLNNAGNGFMTGMIVRRAQMLGQDVLFADGSLATAQNIAQDSAALGSLMDSEATAGNGGGILPKNDTSWHTFATADEVVVETDGSVVIDASCDVFMNFGTWNYVEVRIARTPVGGGTAVQIGAVAGLNQASIPTPGRWQGARIIRRKDIEGGADSLTPGEWVYSLQARSGRPSDAVVDDNLVSNASIIVNSYRKPVAGD